VAKMSEMQDIVSFLKNAESKFVHLYFVKRNRQKINYILLNTRIDPTIGQEFIDIAIKQLEVGPQDQKREREQAHEHHANSEAESVTKALKTLHRHYEHLDALERYRLFVKAKERDDDKIN
jgi:hypothetical protein